MINLLSNEYQKEISAAKQNHTLINYLVIIGVALSIITVTTIFSYVTLGIQQDRYNSINESQAPQKAQYQDDVRLAESYEKDLAAAKLILDNEIKYSDILIQIANTLPNNSRLASFAVESTSLTAPIELSIIARSYDDAVRAKDEFLASDYFTGAKILTIDSMEDGYSAVIVVKVNQQAFAELRDQ